MKKIRLALLYGGNSAEREVSIMGWKVIRAHLDPERYELSDYDTRTDLERLIADAPRLDAAFICLHGRGGEDGSIQGLLELLGIPYQGSGVMASAVAMNKRMSKALFAWAGLPIPRSMALTRGQPLEIESLKEHIPCMVKPVHEGSSVGLTLVRQSANIETALHQAFRCDKEVLIEEYVQGTEVTGAVIGLDKLQAWPLVEIIPKQGHDFFDLQAKYDAAATDEICPARLPSQLALKAQQTALAAHRALNCRGYSRTDMIIRDDTVYVLETNTIPGMTETSLLPKAAKAAGIEYSQLLDLLIDMALQDYRERCLR
jgi:D-alanine-D-alanine ligase